MNGRASKIIRRHAGQMQSKGHKGWTVKDSKRLWRGMDHRRRGEFARAVRMILIRGKQLSDSIGTSVESFSRLSRVLSRSSIRVDQAGVILQRLL